MKTKRLMILLSAVLSLTMFFSINCANALRYPNESNIKVIYQTDQIEFDQPPVINDGRVLVPMRKVFEALNAKVLWDDTSRTITAETDNKKIVLSIDRPTAQIDSDIKGIKNSETIALDVPAKIIGGRTMVPVRFISESLGKKVLWDTSKKTVYIDGIFDTDYKKVILNNYEHAVKKIQGRDITVYYENGDALGLSKTLGINVEEEIFKLCGSDDYFIQAPSKACFSSGDKNDLLVNVSVDNFYFEKQLFLVFTKNQGKYVLQFYNYACEGKSNKSSYNLIDIDSDGKNEILLETSFTGMGNGGSNAVILKYQQQKVERIFDEGLSFNSNSSLFPYENTFTFIRNPLNSNLYDISFKVNIKFDQDIYKAILERGTDIAVPVEDRKDLSGDYIYKFDGKNYVSDKKVIDYQHYYNK